MRLFAPFLLALLVSACAATHAPNYEMNRAAWLERQGGSCEPISREERIRILRMADPRNFPHTKYRMGPRRSIAQETDCSHFVHEIYRRSGLNFNFRETADLKNAPEFDLLPEEEARPGDLMLFRGHVGIVGRDGRIISATQTRRRKRKSSISVLDRKNFRAVSSAGSVLRYRCKPEFTRRIAQDR